jgi:hypothetical protein
MSAVIDFRVFQTARDQAARSGVPQGQAVHRVAKAIAQGMSGQHVCAQYRSAGYAADRERGNGPKDAA